MNAQQFIIFVERLTRALVVAKLDATINFIFSSTYVDGKYEPIVSLSVWIQEEKVYEAECHSDDVEDMINSFIIRYMIPGIKEDYMHVLEGIEHDREEAEKNK